MEFRDFPDDTVLLKALPGEEIVAALTAFLNERKIYAGSFAGIGAVGEAEVAFWDPAARRYLKRVLPGPLEILSVNGNVARTEDGKSFVHAHIVLGDRELRATGGHLFRALAEPTCELVLRPLPGIVERRMEPECGLRLWRLI